MSNPYQSTEAVSIELAVSPPHTKRHLATRFIAIVAAGFTACLLAEFVAHYFQIHGYRGNDKFSTKLERATLASIFFGLPYFVLSIPLFAFCKRNFTHDFTRAAIGGVVAVLVPRTLIGYGLEVQNAVGLDGASLFFFAVGCGAVVGYAVELTVVLLVSMVHFADSGPPTRR